MKNEIQAAPEWKPSLTGAELIPCRLHDQPFVLKGKRYCHYDDGCFVVDGKVVIFFVKDATEDEAKAYNHFNDDDVYTLEVHDEMGMLYVRNDKRVVLCRIAASKPKHDMEIEWGVFANGKCGFYIPASDTFTALPQWDFVWWLRNESTFVSNGCTIKGLPAKGFMEAIEGIDFPAGGEWWRLETDENGMKAAVPVEYNEVVREVSAVDAFNFCIDDQRNGANCNTVVSGFYQCHRCDTVANNFGDYCNAKMGLSTNVTSPRKSSPVLQTPNSQLRSSMGWISSIISAIRLVFVTTTS
jgi:hypothetical protein